MTPQRAAQLLTGLLTFTGVCHFAVPKVFDEIVPGWLPGSARLWVSASGVAELATAALVAVPRTRRAGGVTAAALFVVVFPANIKMAIDVCADGTASTVKQVATILRLPFQVPLVLWALSVARRIAPTIE